MIIDAISITGLAESAVAAGFAKVCKYPTEKEFLAAVEQVEKTGLETAHLKRLVKLAAFEDGSGHKNALKGVTVAMNITASLKWWMQANRYSHFDIVSSMSTQHRLRDLINNDALRFSSDTSMAVVERFLAYAHDNPDLSNSELSQSLPFGAELCARVTTNYLQLRTMWVQRHTHALSEWQVFCDKISTFPYANYFITDQKEEK